MQSNAQEVKRQQMVWKQQAIIYRTLREQDTQTRLYEIKAVLTALMVTLMLVFGVAALLLHWILPLKSG